MINDSVLIEIMSTKSYKVYQPWLKDRGKRLKVLNSIKVVRVIIKLRSIQKEIKSKKGQLFFGF